MTKQVYLLFCIMLLIQACGHKTPGNTELQLLEPQDNAFTLDAHPAKGYVITFMAPECPVCATYVPELNAIKDSFSSDSILFISVFSQKTYRGRDVRGFLTESGLRSDYTVFEDKQQLQQILKATVTPEVFVLDRNFKTLYSGKIDNRMEALGVKRQVTTEFYLKDALNSLLKNEAPRVPHTKAVGCYIE